MKEKPEVKEKDWIRVGMRDAVVCRVYSNEELTDMIEIVFIDDRNRAINIKVIWNKESGKWEFLQDGDLGGYADKYDRLREYVRILRSGKY